MRNFCFLVALALAVDMWTNDSDCVAQINYDEAKVPKYKLPDPLVANDGTRVTTAKQWTEKRRAEVLALFEEHMYGKTPDAKVVVAFDADAGKEALGGKAIRKQVTMRIGDKESGPAVDILIYLPAKAKRPVPLFVGMNFYGNQTVHKDPSIKLPTSWVRSNTKFGIPKNRATDSSRGVRTERWQVEKIIAKGYGLAVIYYGDIDPDYHDGFKNGVHPLFYKKGQTKPAPNEWGSIGAWAWGLSRAMDYFETDDDIDAKRVAVMGHSRLGKTSLWAGASDPRFALVISNDSGCGGAALSRRRFGETLAVINGNFPHWFCGNFKKYNNKEDTLPLDQHMLIALCAPRPVLINSATVDRWADPHGEFLSAKGADAVYRLLGTDGMSADKWPEPNKVINSTIGYHLRPGRHDVTARDWDVYLEFADKHMRGKAK